MKRTIVTLVVMLIAPLAFAQTSSTHKRQATTTEQITVTGTIIPTPVGRLHCAVRYGCANRRCHDDLSRGCGPPESGNDTSPDN
jgi:hypothetical protein